MKTLKQSKVKPAELDDSQSKILVVATTKFDSEEKPITDNDRINTEPPKPPLEEIHEEIISTGEFDPDEVRELFNEKKTRVEKPLSKAEEEFIKSMLGGVEIETEEEKEEEETIEKAIEPDVSIKMAAPQTPAQIHASALLISRKPIAMRILKHLLNNGPSSVMEVYEGLNDSGYKLFRIAVGSILRKMAEAGILNAATSSVDRRYVFYEINNKFPIDSVLRHYYRWLGRRLYKLVPYEGIYLHELIRDKNFLLACSQHGLSVDEAASAIMHSSGKVDIKEPRGEDMRSNKATRDSILLVRKVQ